MDKQEEKNVRTSSAMITDRVDFYAYQSIVVNPLGVPVVFDLLLNYPYMQNYCVPKGKALIDIAIYPLFQGVDYDIQNDTYTSISYMIRDYQSIDWRILTKSNLSSGGDGDNITFIKVTPSDKNYVIPIEKTLWGGQQLRMKVDLTTAFPSGVPTQHIYYVDFLIRTTGRLVNDTEAKNLQYVGTSPYGEMRKI